MTTSRRRSFAFAVISIFGSMLFVLVATEFVLRFFPVEMSPRTMALNAENTVLRAPPNRRFSHSVGWNFRHPNSGRINNAGFFNDQDYSPDGPRPLIAVIGDSYIEAKMVPYEDTIQGRLAADIGESGRVYSFAMSGAPLSQYLAWIGYARDAYAPDAVIITIVANDFDESHVKYGIRAGFYHYYDNEGGSLRLRMTEYVPSFWRTMALKSALARYLAFHLRIRESWANLRTTVMGLFGGSPQRQDPRYVGSTLAAASEERRTLSISVVDAFLHDLPKHSGLPPKRILLLVDGLRSSIYAPERAARDQSSFFASMRHYLVAKATVRSYAVIDLHEVFEADYRRKGKRFEFDIDAHWRAYGHGVVARAVMQSPWYAGVVGVE